MRDETRDQDVPGFRVKVADDTVGVRLAGNGNLQPGFAAIALPVSFADNPYFQRVVFTRPPLPPPLPEFGGMEVLPRRPPPEPEVQPWEKTIQFPPGIFRRPPEPPWQDFFNSPDRPQPWPKPWPIPWPWPRQSP